MSEKGKDTLIIILILVIIALTCTICYVVIKKNFGGVTPAVENSGEVNNNSNTNENANNSSNSNSNSSNTNTTLSSVDVKNLVDKYYLKTMGSSYTNEIFANLDDMVKATIAAVNVDESKVETYNGSDGCRPYALDVKKIKVSDVKAKYKELFGVEMPNIDKTYSNYVVYKFILEGDYYVRKDDFCGGPYNDVYDNYTITNYVQTGNELEVTLDLNLNLDNPTLEGLYGPKNIVEEMIKKGDVKAKYTYKVTFEYKNGNYILVSSKEA